MLELVGRINERHFRETNFLLSHWTLYQIFGFFINYLLQIGLRIGLISFRPKFSNISY